MMYKMPEENYALIGNSDTYHGVWDRYQWSDSRGTRYILAEPAESVNKMLLEALKEAEWFIKKNSGGGETDFRKKLNEAIAAAEKESKE